jgi:hypothetical protein
LVNTLLDFSRLEAGRAQATFVATDLAALTADLASTFRPAMERAGLTLTIDAQPQEIPAYVDREMCAHAAARVLAEVLNCDHALYAEVEPNQVYCTVTGSLGICGKAQPFRTKERRSRPTHTGLLPEGPVGRNGVDSWTIATAI